MMCFEISANSGLSCSAWRNEAEASAKARSSLSLTPKLRLRSPSFGVGVCDASSGGMRRVLELGPGRQALRLDHARIARLLYAERIAHGTGDDLQLLLVLVGKATSMTKKATSSPIKSAKVTYQPCPTV
jgi:hypothetical protein